VTDLCTSHVAAGAQSDLIWMHRLVIAEVPPTVQKAVLVPALASSCLPVPGNAVAREAGDQAGRAATRDTLASARIIAASRSEEH
jgi:hypothetical protein